MQFNLTTIFFLLPSLITLMIMRLRRQPWMKTLSVLGWRLGSPIHYLWALLALLISAIPTVLLVLFLFSDLYRHPPQGITLYYYAHLGFSLSSVLSAFLNEFFFTALGEEVFFRGLLGGWLMRRFGFLLGNTLQTIIFFLPHALFVLVAPNLWPLLIFPAALGWVNGWLRYKTESVLPGMLIHGLGNTINGIFAMLRI